MLWLHLTRKEPQEEGATQVEGAKAAYAAVVHVLLKAVVRYTELQYPIITAKTWYISPLNAKGQTFTNAVDLAPFVVLSCIATTRFTSRMPLIRDQKGIQSVNRLLASAGYPSVFLPASVQQQPQKMAAGQQIICDQVRRKSRARFTVDYSYSEEHA